MVAAPELTDAAGLEKIVRTAVAEGTSVFSFEDPARFPLSAELVGPVKLEFPDARGLWNIWLAADGQTRAKWSAEIPQPMYLKPPHITPAKRSWLVQP